MLDQVRSIVQAADMLVGRVGTPQERLAKGFTAFRQAAIFSQDWPVDVWEKYNCICETLLAGGTWQKTIGRMGLQAASECATQISRAMNDLAVAVELARSSRSDSASRNSTVRVGHVGGVLKEQESTNAANRK